MSNQFHKVIDGNYVLFEIYDQDKKMIFKVSNPASECIESHNERFNLTISFDAHNVNNVKKLLEIGSNKCLFILKISNIIDYYYMEEIHYTKMYKCEEFYIEYNFKEEIFTLKFRNCIYLDKYGE